MDFNGLPWIARDFHGFLWISMGCHACQRSVWFCMDFHGFPSGSLEIHGLPTDVPRTLQDFTYILQGMAMELSWTYLELHGNPGQRASEKQAIMHISTETVQNRAPRQEREHLIYQATDHFESYRLEGMGQPEKPPEGGKKEKNIKHRLCDI